MRRFWPVLLLIVPLAVALPFLPLRRIAWKVMSEDDDPYLIWTVWFMSRQQPDGSWDAGPARMEGHPLNRPGTTGLALLAFMGAGYSHLSKDVYEWYDTGHSVKSGLQWLMRDQLPDGTFRSSAGTLDHTVATFALSEAYGLTGSNLFQRQAQLAMDALVAKVLDGELKEDPALHAWAALALASAKISGLQSKREAVDRILAFYDSRKDGPADAGEIVARILLEKHKTHPRLAPGIARLAARPPAWDQQDFPGWHWATLAAFQYDGPSGPAWTAWKDPLGNTLVKTQSSRGDWPGRTRGDTFVRTCLAAHTLLVYYRYANVFGAR